MFVQKPLEQWLGEYSESHRNPINKLIHWFAVPSILLCSIALLWAVPTPDLFESIPLLNWGTLGILICMGFYLRLSLRLSIGMLGVFTLIIWVINSYERAQLGSVEGAAGLLFAIMWVFQFIGHHVEGKKPSFFKDLQFLLIGPLWVVAFLYRNLGIKY